MVDHPVKFLSEIPMYGLTNDIIAYLQLLHGSSEDGNSLEATVLGRDGKHEGVDSRHKGVMVFSDNSGDIRGFLNRLNVPWGDIAIRKVPLALHNSPRARFRNNRAFVEKHHGALAGDVAMYNHPDIVRADRVFFISHADSFYEINHPLQHAPGEETIPEDPTDCRVFRKAVTDSLHLACLDKGINNWADYVEAQASEEKAYSGMTLSTK